MRKAITLLLTAVIMIVLASNTYAVKAADNGEIVMAYCQSDNLYAYVSLPSDIDAAGLTVQARIGSEQYEIKKPKLQKVSENSSPVSYVFMVDISTSMPKYKDNIDKFIEAVVATAQGNASYLAVTFGEKFKQIGDFTDNKQEFLQTIDGIEYNAEQTSLYAGIIDAIDFCDQKERADGEIINLIIISDGMEYDKNGPTQSEVKEYINQASPILIHTFGLYTRKSDEAEMKDSEEALKVLGSFSRATLGIHTTFGRDEFTEEEIAGQITDYMNNLYFAPFNLFMHTPQNTSFDLGLLFSPIGDTGKMFRLDKANVPYLQQEDNSDASSADDGAISGDNGTNSDTEDSPDTDTGNGSEDEAGSGSGNSAEDEAQNGSGNSAEDEAQNGSDDSAEDESGNDAGEATTDASGDSSADTVAKKISQCPELFGINVYLLGGVLLGIIALFAATIYFITRKRTVPVANDIHKIFMKLEVINGKCSNKKKELFLAEEFIIGRNKKCHIRFKNKDVANKNSRVFVRDNIIYVEDLGSTNGTAISGMKIHAPNRLRSGDEISIGTVRFKLKF